MCNLCELPERNIWTHENLPNTHDVVVGDWISLKVCPQCNGLWSEVPYEPYGSFPFLVAWPYHENDFTTLLDSDNYLALHEWHAAVIREKWAELPSNEQEAVNKWRRRTYGSYNPIDQNVNENPPKFITQSEAIEQYVSSSI